MDDDVTNIMGRGVNSSSKLDLRGIVSSAELFKLKLNDSGGFFQADMGHIKNDHEVYSSLKGTCDVGQLIAIGKKAGFTYSEITSGVDFTGSAVLPELKKFLTASSQLREVKDPAIKRSVDSWAISGKELEGELKKWGLKNPGGVFSKVDVLGVDLDGTSKFKVPVRSGFKDDLFALGERHAGDLRGNLGENEVLKWDILDRLESPETLGKVKKALNLPEDIADDVAGLIIDAFKWRAEETGGTMFDAIKFLVKRDFPVVDDSNKTPEEVKATGAFPLSELERAWWFATGTLANVRLASSVSRRPVKSAMHDTEFVGVYEDDDGALYMPDEDPAYDSIDPYNDDRGSDPDAPEYSPAWEAARSSKQGSRLGFKKPVASGKGKVNSDFQDDFGDVYDSGDDDGDRQTPDDIFREFTELCKRRGEVPQRFFENTRDEIFRQLVEVGWDGGNQFNAQQEAEQWAYDNDPDFGYLESSKQSSRLGFKRPVASGNGRKVQVKSSLVGEEVVVDLSEDYGGLSYNHGRVVAHNPDNNMVKVLFDDGYGGSYQADDPRMHLGSINGFKRPVASGINPVHKKVYDDYISEYESGSGDRDYGAWFMQHQHSISQDIKQACGDYVSPEDACREIIEYYNRY
jgi:hypothetical protein